MKPGDRATTRDHRRRAPVPALVALAVLLALGPVAYAASRDRTPPQRISGPTLAQIARGAGCRLTEFQDGMDTNVKVAAVTNFKYSWALLRISVRCISIG